MKYLYFPGNSVKNKVELDQFKEKFSKEGLDIYTHEYAHWQDESLSFDLEREIERVKSNIDIGGQYVILGKSIGTLMSVSIATELNILPTALILMGIPDQILEQNIERYENGIEKSKQVIVLQNQNDPFGSAEKIKSMLGNLEIQFIEKQGDTHEYMYSDEVFEMVK